MNHMAQDNDDSKRPISTDELLNYLWMLMAMPKLPEGSEMSERIGEEDVTLRKIIRYLMDLRDLSGALSKGDLDKLVYSKGYMLSNLKALQSNLRHLTWQTKKIADGDFTQKVDFLGEFSDSFNEMTAKLKSYSERLKFQANIDQLTQLPNRHFLMPFLSKCFDRFRRDGEDFSVLIMDIDHFKKVNDTYGHIAGDKVLTHLSELLNGKFRSSDVFTRYGGEEFLAVLINTQMDDALIIAERARQAVESAIIHIADDQSISVSVSIGVSQTMPDDPDFYAIIKRSDEALYAAKNGGRNQVTVL